MSGSPERGSRRMGGPIYTARAAFASVSCQDASMRLPVLPSSAGARELPLWPPLLATRGPGSKSEPHAHHAMHLILALDGLLKVRAPLSEPWVEAAGVLTAPDAKHSIDARGVEVVLVFFDPESDVGEALGQLSS